MPNDSSTGGPLQPTGVPTPAPLEGTDLLNFIQQWLVNVTGLVGTLVRPSWQPEPPNIPPAATAWLAFAIKERHTETYPAVVHVSTNDGHDVMHRHETLVILCSAYDTGSTGQADLYASLLRDNASIPQNQEYLQLGNFSFISTGPMIALPTLLKQRWLNRIDVELTLRREIIRDYAVLNLLEAGGTITTDIGPTTVPFDTNAVNP